MADDPYRGPGDPVMKKLQRLTQQVDRLFANIDNLERLVQYGATACIGRKPHKFKKFLVEKTWGGYNTVFSNKTYVYNCGRCGKPLPKREEGSSTKGEG